MFDIFTIQTDGGTQLVVSVSCLAQAQDVARGLSCLVPGEYFGYFERIENVKPVATPEGGTVETPNNSMSLSVCCRSESEIRFPMGGDCAMSAFASGDKKKPANLCIRNYRVNPVREKMTLIFDTILVLSLQLVFRATVMARHLNY